MKYRLVWLRVHAKWAGRDAIELVKRTLLDFTDDHCPQLAASISYYVLVSIFPLTIFFIGIAGLVLRDEGLRADFIDVLVERLPLSEQEARSDLNDALDNVATGFSIGAIVGLAGLLWSASAMMGALRFALNQAWDTEYRRPLVAGKLVDLAMVLAVGLLLAASIASTMFLQVARRASDDLSEWLGPLGEGATLGVELLALLVPLTLSFLTFLAVFTLVPSIKTRLSYVWPGALLSAILFEVLKNGFALYLRHFGSYDVIYGSLGAVLAFLFFVYLSAIVVLLGAEMAAEWPRVTHGWYDEDEDTAPADAAEVGSDGRGRITGFLLSLVRSEEPTPQHVSDEAQAARRRARIRSEIARTLGSER